MIRQFVFNILLDEEEERINNHERFRQLNLQKRLLRDASDPFTVPTHHFVKYYRLNQEESFRLIELVEPRLVGERSTAIPVHLQVLMTLRFMAEGSLQKGLAQDYNHPMGQSTVSRCIFKVVDAILFLHDMFVQFPTTPQARQTVQNGFQRTMRIPGIIGVVDCFLVNFRKPSENEEAFFNYRVGCSMNVQLIVDSNYNILNVRICPGSNNDRFVWQFSYAKKYLEYLRANEDILQQEGRYYVPGDSGYTPSPTLLTPVLNTPEGSPASLYTGEHVRTRRYVEQSIGILTNLWMAIKRCRKLHYAPEAVARIINAGCILHNSKRRHGIAVVGNQQFNVQINDGHPRRNGDYAAGIVERNDIIDRYY